MIKETQICFCIVPVSSMADSVAVFSVSFAVGVAEISPVAVVDAAVDAAAFVTLSHVLNSESLWHFSESSTWFHLNEFTASYGP